MEKILFFHGGPGLNGNPERHLLTELYRQHNFELLCWDEPSLLRKEGYPFTTENAFEQYVHSAGHFLAGAYDGKPLVLILYCFASHLLPNLVSQHPEKIKQLIVVSPDFILSGSDCNIFSLAERDYREKNDIEMANAVDTIIQHYALPHDDNTKTGWELALQNPRLFSYYWQSEALRMQYTRYYNGAYDLDPLSFFAVRKNWRPYPAFSTGIPTTVVYGRHDRIVSVAQELQAIPNWFSNVQFVEFAASSHYPHIEEIKKMLRLVRQVATAPADSHCYPQQADEMPQLYQTYSSLQTVISTQ